MSNEKKIKRFPLTSNPRPSDKEPIKRPLPPKNLKYTISCKNCDEKFVLFASPKDITAWITLEKDIDEALPSFTQKEKDMISTQLCSNCLEKFFGS